MAKTKKCIFEDKHEEWGKKLLSVIYARKKLG